MKFAGENQVTTVLSDLLENLLGVAEKEVNQLLNKSNFSTLTSKQKKVLEIISDRLGLDGLERVETLKQKYKSLKEQARETITKVAKTSVEVGFTYEYRRISTKSILFRGKFSNSALKKYHFDLLSGNLKSVIESYQNGNEEDIKVEHYLQETKKEKTKAWGFSLGFAGISRKEELEEVVRRNIYGNQQITFSGDRRYEDKFFGNKTIWGADFNVSMPEFSANATPLASEFDYALYLTLEWKDKKLKKREDLLKHLDQGVLWKAIPQGEMLSLAEELYPKMKKDTLTVTSQLKLSPYAFEQLMNRMIVLNERNDIISQSLGAAMPYDQDQDIRRNVELRSKYYGKVWHHYLENPVSGNENTYLTFTYQTLKPVSPQLAKNERAFMRKHQEETVRINSSTDDQWMKFKKGIHRLHSSIHKPTPYTEVIKQSYREIRAFWSLPFYTRALGHYLLHLASDRPDILDEMERIFTISYQGDEGKEEVINLTTNI